MAYIECKLKSQRLLTTVGVKIYLPCDLPVEVGNKVKGVFTLLHGFTNSGDDWMQMTAAPRYAADNGLALVAPDCGNSFYQDMTYGGAWAGFVTEEMPALLRAMFHLPAEREKNFIGGLSMGGFGAIVNGLQHPQTFGAVAALSSALILDSMLEHTQYTDFLMTNKGYYESVFGELSQVRGGVNDYDALAEKVAKEPVRPKFYLACGTEDGLLGVNRQFRDHLLRLGYDVTYEEGPGVHDWYFWDEYILKALNWLPLADAQQGISSGNVGV